MADIDVKAYYTAIRDKQRAASPSAKPVTPNEPPCSDQGTGALISVDEISKRYASLRKRALADYSKHPRSLHKTRYHGTMEMDGKRVPREIPPLGREMWDNHPSEAHSLIIGEKQLAMRFYEEPKDPTGKYSIFNLSEAWEYTRDRILTCKYDGKSIQVPTKIRPSDALLGACYVWLFRNTSLLFPADVNPDAYIFPDRKSFGEAFRPRLRHVDYPKNDKEIPDTRIAFIEHGDDGPVIFLGGEKFDVHKQTNQWWANLHHHAVNITEASVTHPVRDEPEERKRQERALKHKHALRPVGAIDEITLARRRVSHLSDRFVQGAASLNDIKEVINAVPIRGHQATVPSWEAMEFAKLSGAMQSQFIGLMLQSFERNWDANQDLIDRLNVSLSNLAAEYDDDDSGEFTEICTILNDMSYEASRMRAVAMRINEIIEDVPTPDKIIGAVCDERGTNELIAIVDLALKAVMKIEHQPLFHKRETWMTPLNHITNGHAGSGIGFQAIVDNRTVSTAHLLKAALSGNAGAEQSKNPKLVPGKKEGSAQDKVPTPTPLPKNKKTTPPKDKKNEKKTPPKDKSVEKHTPLEDGKKGDKPRFPTTHFDKDVPSLPLTGDPVDESRKTECWYAAFDPPPYHPHPQNHSWVLTYPKDCTRQGDYGLQAIHDFGYKRPLEKRDPQRYWLQNRVNTEGLGYSKRGREYGMFVPTNTADIKDSAEVNEMVEENKAKRRKKK